MNAFADAVVHFVERTVLLRLKKWNLFPSILELPPRFVATIICKVCKIKQNKTTTTTHAYETQQQPQQRRRRKEDWQLWRHRSLFSLQICKFGICKSERQFCHCTSTQSWQLWNCKADDYVTAKMMIMSLQSWWLCHCKAAYTAKLIITSLQSWLYHCKADYHVTGKLFIISLQSYCVPASKVTFSLQSYKVLCSCSRALRPTTNN